MAGKPLEKVSSFKYMGATPLKGGTCNVKIRAWVITATPAMVRLERLWNSNISVQTKYQALQITGRIDSPLRVWDLDTPGWSRKKSRLSRTICLRKAPPHLLGAENQWTGTKSKVLWSDKSLVLSVGRCYGLATSHDIIDSARSPCRTLLKADTSGHCNARSGQITSNMTMLELLRANANR